MPDEIAESLKVLQRRATRLARAAKRLESDHNAAQFIDGQLMIPASTPKHFSDFDRARAGVLEMIARSDLSDAS